MFNAYVVDQTNDGIVRQFRTFTTDELPKGEVLVNVEYSSVNYKDGLATRANGGVARRYPLIPGIDLAGEVLESADQRFKRGDQVIAHGYGLGVEHHGGFAEVARVPAEWIVPLPDPMTTRAAMAIGTAGFTAAMSVLALQRHDVWPDTGPVLVTGATGGVGSISVMLLAKNGYEVIASTGSPTTPWLESLGASEVIPRFEFHDRPLGKQLWAAAIDCVGGRTLSEVLKSLRYRGVVAASGLAGGADLPATVLPFILRGVSLLGIDSVEVPRSERCEIWRWIAAEIGNGDSLAQISTEVTLRDIGPVLDSIVEGGVSGRVVVVP